MIRIFAYGTLRGRGWDAEIEGFTKEDPAGMFPTIYPDPNGVVEGEVFEIPERLLRQFDVYEGYDSDHPESSLYVRMQMKDGTHVYIANVRVHRHWKSDYELEEVEKLLEDREPNRI